MLIYAIDDEPAMLEELHEAIAAAEPNAEIMRRDLDRSLMVAAALNPIIGYENAARAASLALSENISLREACVKLDLLSGERFDEVVRPDKMI